MLIATEFALSDATKKYLIKSQLPLDPKMHGLAWLSLLFHGWESRLISPALLD